jgi:hypothetical protein
MVYPISRFAKIQAKSEWGWNVKPVYNNSKTWSSQVILFLLVPFLLSFAACSHFIGSAAKGLAGSLTMAIRNSDDPATVRDGSPAYLLMIDGLVENDPENESILRTAASLYSLYAGVFVEDKDRAARMTDKALNYAFRAVCMQRSDACSLKTDSFENFSHIISTMTAREVPAFYTLGSAWAGYIQNRQDDWNAVAQLARVESIMKRIVELDEGYEDGGAHLYLGALATLAPEAMGGRPEEGRRHFERAIELSGGKNLMIKVMYARQYARLVFDRELHDRLLNEVLEAETNIRGYVLINTLARDEAGRLLAESGDYF